MLENCAVSCGVCSGPPAPAPPPPPPTPGPTPAPTSGGTPVEQWGRLRVEGNNIVGENGDVVQLKGMSFFWSQWQGQYYTTPVVNWLVDDWKCSLVRAVLGIHESSGYLQDPWTEKAKIELVVNAAIAKGVYVLIDWHDHHAEWHINEAKGFFDEMARKYGSYPNVLFETYNEPLAVSWSGVIKPYHQQLVSVIRQYSDNIIVLGNRDWCQHPDEAARDPVSGSNLAYTIHFYAFTHRGELREKVVQAKSAGGAVFATEWGTCRADGNGQLDLGETNVWLDFLAYHGVSYANWAVSDKNEACSALTPGAPTNGGWSDGQLTASGRYMKGAISGNGGGGSGGCCRFGADCGDCGEDGTGWCHQSASNCAVCTGTFDPSGSAPSCVGNPSPVPTPSTAPSPAAPAPPSPTPVGSPVELHGRLSVQGNKIVDQYGEAVQFRGMSFFWSQWQGKYWNAGAVDFMAQDWKCTLVRAAMGVESGGYLDNPNGEKAKVIAVVDAAIAKGIYVIIDWHDHHAENHVEQAKAFFAEMAQRYGQYPNVIFETYNEPLQVDWSGVIKPYHEQLVPVIRNYAPDSIIVLGTKTWSQDVDLAANDPVQGTNLAYTLHFYAATHKGGLRNKAMYALNRGIALMVTEWGTCDASGDGALDLGSSV